MTDRKSAPPAELLAEIRARAEAISLSLTDAGDEKDPHETQSKFSKQIAPPWPGMSALGMVKSAVPKAVCA